MKPATALPFVPRILRRDLAAMYVGLGTTSFDAEVAAGRAPRPVQITDGVRGWCRLALDAWIDDRMAASGAADTANPWDAA